LDLKKNVMKRKFVLLKICFNNRDKYQMP